MHAEHLGHMLTMSFKKVGYFMPVGMDDNFFNEKTTTCTQVLCSDAIPEVKMWLPKW